MSESFLFFETLALISAIYTQNRVASACFFFIEKIIPLKPLLFPKSVNLTKTRTNIAMKSHKKTPITVVKARSLLFKWNPFVCAVFWSVIDWIVARLSQKVVAQSFRSNSHYSVLHSKLQILLPNRLWSHRQISENESLS